MRHRIAALLHLLRRAYHQRQAERYAEHADDLQKSLHDVQISADYARVMRDHHQIKAHDADLELRSIQGARP